MHWAGFYQLDREVEVVKAWPKASATACVNMPKLGLLYASLRLPHSHRLLYALFCTPSLHPGSFIALFLLLPPSI